MSQDNENNRRNRIIIAGVVSIFAAIAIILASFVFSRDTGKEQDNEQLQRDEYFIDKQIIVVGENLVDLPNEVRTVNPDIELTLRDENSLSLAGNNSETSTDRSQFITSAALQGAEAEGCGDINLSQQINLYDLTGSDSEIESAIAAITTARGNDVSVEPNWIVGTPWSPTGSPWSPTGSSGGGNPTLASQTYFDHQWAFDNIGLNGFSLPDGLIPEELPQIKIALFDTSAMEATSLQTAPFLDPNTGIQFAHPEFVQMPPTPEPENDINVANHGFFGTGFIEKLAPNSEIEIIRVLTTYNRGDLFTLNRELLKFVSENANAEIKPIINLSLGIPHLYVEGNQTLPFDFTRNFDSLRIITSLADCLDMVVVAASGNDSATDKHLPSNYPAAWPWVLGVTASTEDLKQSCYANDGNVAAPGGNGGNDDNAEIATDCAPVLKMCNGSDCPFGVVGPVHPKVSNDEYHFWVGTSFATPIVTGLAALVRQSEEALGTAISAKEIRDAILCGSTQVNITQQNETVNVIHVPSTFDCLGLGK